MPSPSGHVSATSNSGAGGEGFAWKRVAFQAYISRQFHELRKDVLSAQTRWIEVGNNLGRAADDRTHLDPKLAGAAKKPEKGKSSVTNHSSSKSKSNPEQDMFSTPSQYGGYISGRAIETLQGKLFGNPRVHICFSRRKVYSERLTDLDKDYREILDQFEASKSDDLYS